MEGSEKSVGTLRGKAALGALVVRKKPAAPGNKPCPVALNAATTSHTGNTLYLLPLVGEL